jgi:hypothetical protein
MYVPLQNYKDLEPDFLENYWLQGKDLLGVTHFGDLVPEVMSFGEEYEKILLELIDMRIDYKLRKLQGNKLNNDIKTEILTKKLLLKDKAEKEILSRLNALRKYLRTPERDPHISLEEIFRQREKRTIKTLITPLMKYFPNRKSKLLTDEIKT